MNGLEAVGDAVTGGLAGRALEPAAGEAGAGHTHETACLNCGAVLTGPFCAECGQHAHVHRTLSAFFHDFLHGVLHFEGKIWRTLPLLAWRPGELTRRYIDGQRASFVSPIALFLFCVFLTFSVMGLTGTQFAGGSGKGGVKAVAELQDANADTKRKLGDLEEQRAEAVAKSQPTTEIDAEIRSVRSALELQTSLAQMATGRASAEAQRQADLSPAKPVTGGKFGNVHTGISVIDHAIQKANTNPELLFYKIKTNAYKFSWALIPISVPFVWLLFPFSRRSRLYDHTVFVTYSLCFMMLLLVTGTVIGLLSSTMASLAWLVPPIHMYRHLRGTYAVGRFGAAWRTFALTIFAFLAIALFSGLLVTLGAFD
jgi:hypothetical protein